jgi:hypothetical protein
MTDETMLLSMGRVSMSGRFCVNDFCLQVRTSNFSIRLTSPVYSLFGLLFRQSHPLTGLNLLLSILGFSVNKLQHCGLEHGWMEATTLWFKLLALVGVRQTLAAS